MKNKVRTALICVAIVVSVVGLALGGFLYQREQAFQQHRARLMEETRRLKMFEKQLAELQSGVTRLEALREEFEQRGDEEWSRVIRERLPGQLKSRQDELDEFRWRVLNR